MESRLSEHDPPDLLDIWAACRGKTTLCQRLLREYEYGYHLSMDDLRGGVVSGLADSVPWTEETERQFQIAETAACDIARRYHEAGFAVAIDHCRNMPVLERAINVHLSDLPVVKVCLIPCLETNLERNRTRTNKPFGPDYLVETIVWTNANYRLDVPPGWQVLDNTSLSVEESVNYVLTASQTAFSTVHE